MRNLLKRCPRDEAKPTLRERAAALKATAGRVMRRPKLGTSAQAVVAMAPHHPGMMPYPPAAPTVLIEVDLAIRLEAARLLELAEAEFDRRFATLAEGLDEAGCERVGDRLQAELRMRALAEAADDADLQPPIDWRKAPAGYMAHPAIEPEGFLSIAEALPLEAERLHGIAQAEFERRRDAYRPATSGPNAADWSASLWRALRVDAWAAVASPERAEPAGDDLSEPGFILFEDTAGGTQRKPVADWIAYMALRLYHVARAEEARGFNAACASEPDQDANALYDRFRRDLRIDALHDLAFRSREVFEASREFAVGDRWRNGRGDATDIDAELLALEAEFVPAHRAAEDAHAAYALVSDTYEDPAVPIPLRVWRNDWITSGIPRSSVEAYETVRGKFVRVVHYGEREVAQMRGMRCVRLAYGGAGELQPDGTRGVPDPRAQERVDAIVAAWDRWQAEIAAKKKALGLPALIAAHEAARDRREPILERLRATPARTLAGLGVKARVAFALDGDTDPKRTGIEEYDVEVPEAFIFDVAGDVLAMVGGVAPPHPDAALLAMEAPIMAALAAREPLCRAHNAADLLAIRSPTEDNRRASDEAESTYEDADSLVLDLTRDLADLRATTLAGLILKARWVEHGDDDLRDSIVADLLAMG